MTMMMIIQKNEIEKLLLLLHWPRDRSVRVALLSKIRRFVCVYVSEFVHLINHVDVGPLAQQLPHHLDVPIKGGLTKRCSPILDIPRAPPHPLIPSLGAAQAAASALKSGRMGLKATGRGRAKTVEKGPESLTVSNKQSRHASQVCCTELRARLALF